MSTSALYTPARRAPRIVRPYNTKRESPAARARRLVWHGEEPAPETPRPASSAADFAQRKGYSCGLMDEHYFPDLHFCTSSEWIAFGRGHRAGYAELKAERAREWAERKAEAAK